MSSAAKASGNAAQTPKTVSPLANLSLSDLAVFIRLPPLLTVLEKEKKAADSLAERVGFEPTIRLRVFRFSRPARSTAPSPLRLGGFYQRGGSTRRFDGLESAHIWLQRHRDVHAAIGALIVLHDRDQGAPHGEAGTVQGVHQLGPALLVAEARLHAPRLERLAVAARGNLPIGVLPRQPDFDVVGFGGLEAHVACTQRHDAVGELQRSEERRVGKEC